MTDYKVVMLGESGTGKTSLLEKLISGIFSAIVSPTVGAAYVKTTIQMPGRSVTMNIWDTAGQEKFQSLIPLYIRNAHGLVFVFDVSSDPHLQGLATVYSCVDDQITADMQLVLCANKIDLVPQSDLHLEVAEAWGRNHGMEMVQTSAFTGYGVLEMFTKIAEKIAAQGETRRVRGDDLVNDICRGEVEQKKCC
jgi:small GTP-binding protein